MLNNLNFTAVLKKLKYKEGMRFLIVNAPDEYTDNLNIPKDLSPSGVLYDIAQVFVYNKGDADKYLPEVSENLKHDGIFWVSYPKKSGKIKSDVNRDKGWEAINSKGYVGVASVSISDDFQL